MRTPSRTASTRGDTPRTWTLASVPVWRRGKAAITTTSALTSALGRSLTTPGASSTGRVCSRGRMLSSSEFEPARRTMALAGEPEETRVALKPLARASVATNTPTVPAIPSTATTAEVQRSRTPRRL